MSVHPLITASKEGDLESIRSLLRLPHHSEDSPHRDCITLALFPASQNGHLDIAQCLVEEGFADLHNTGETNCSTPLHLACSMGRTEVAMYLARSGRHTAVHALDKSGHPPHICACYEGYLDIAKHLMHRFHLNVNQSYGVEDQLAPIHWAARINHPTLTAFLIAAGADVNTTDCQSSPLHFACTRALHSRSFSSYSSSRPTLDILLQHGADIDATDGCGNTPLLVAIKSNQVEVVGRLLEYNPCVRHTNLQGENALGMACRLNHAKIVHLLVGHGVSVIDSHGWHLLVRACKHRQKDIVRMLLVGRMGQTQPTQSPGSKRKRCF